MPAEDGASGKKFLHFREAMSYAQDTWGVPPPQAKPVKEYAVNDIVGKSIFEDISHKNTITASKVVMLVVPDDHVFEKEAMAAHSMPPENTNWDRISTYGPKIMKRIALLGQALGTMKPGNKIFVPYLRMKALDACNIKKAGSVDVDATVPEAIRSYAETRSYRYSNPSPPSNALWDAVQRRGTSRKGSLFEASAGKLKSTVPPLFDQSQERTADFSKYVLTRMRDVPYIDYVFKWPSVRVSFGTEESEALSRVGISVGNEENPVEKARIAYSVQTVRVPRVGSDTTWGILQFEAYLKKERGAPTITLQTPSPRPAMTDKDIPRISNMIQRNARAIMDMRKSARQDGDRYLYPIRPARRREQPREVDIGEDMPLYESLEGIQRTCNQMLWHSVTGVPEGIPVEMKGQMGSEVETHGGSSYMGTMYLRKTRLAAKMFDLIFQPDAEMLMDENERRRLIEASKLLCRGTDPLTLIERDPEFVGIRGISWPNLAPEAKQRVIDKASHLAGDDDVGAQRRRRDDPANWPALKFLGQKIHEFISDGTIELEREDFVDGNTICQVYEPYKQRRPVVNNYGMPMVVDEQQTRRDENGDVAGDMVTRPYSMEDFRAGRKGSMENLDISASHSFEPMVHQGVTYGRQYDPESGREVFKPIPGLASSRVRGIPVVYPASQMEYKYSFGREDRRSVKGIMWKFMDEDARNKPQPGEVIEAIIQMPDVFTKVLDPKQNMERVLKDLRGWELTKLDQYQRKTYTPAGVKYSTKNKAPTSFTTRDFERAPRASDRPLMVPQYDVVGVGGLRQRRLDEAGNPVMVEASQANLDIERYDGENYFRDFSQGLDVLRAFFGSGPTSPDAWGDNAIGPYPNVSLHDMLVAFQTSHTGMSLYLRYKNDGTLDMHAGTWTDASGQQHRFNPEELQLLREGQKLLSSIMEVGPLEDAESEEGEEGDESNEDVRIPTSYYRDAAVTYEAARRAAENPEQQDDNMAEVCGPERGTMYAVMFRSNDGSSEIVKIGSSSPVEFSSEDAANAWLSTRHPDNDAFYVENLQSAVPGRGMKYVIMHRMSPSETVRLRIGSDYPVVFPSELVAREWIRTHHPEDAAYYASPLPADGPLPFAPSHIMNIGEPGTLATDRGATEMFNHATIVEAIRSGQEEVEEPEEPVAPEAPAEPEAPSETTIDEDLFGFQGEEEPAQPEQDAGQTLDEELEALQTEPSMAPAAEAPGVVPTPVPPAAPAAPAPSRTDREAAAISRLVALADRLDDAGRTEEAEAVDGVIQYSIKNFRKER